MIVMTCANGSRIAARKPNKSNRKRRYSFNEKFYKNRHRIENAICRLKDFRRIATRYDKLARLPRIRLPRRSFGVVGFMMWALIERREHHA
jgi:transposase